MKTRNTDPQSSSLDNPKVIRLVDVKSARPEAVPPDAGIRPTREGPWDPRRFQEYEISPEARREIMAMKAPAADPSLFVETLPPTNVTEILSPGGNNTSASTNALDEEASIIPRSVKGNVAEHSKRNLVRRLVIASVVVGLLVGFLAARERKVSPRPSQEPALLPAPNEAKLTSAAASKAVASNADVSSSPASSMKTAKVDEPSKARSTHSPAETRPTARTAAPKKIQQKASSGSDDDSTSAWVEPK